jgi:hypothetical protein
MNSAMCSTEGLHLEVEESPETFAGEEIGHLKAIWVGWQSTAAEIVALPLVSLLQFCRIRGAVVHHLCSTPPRRETRRSIALPKIEIQQEQASNHRTMNTDPPSNSELPPRVRGDRCKADRQ